MGNKPTPQDIRDSIVPNSEQLNAEDLLTGPIVVKITRISTGPKDQPVFVHLEGYTRTFRPCKTCRRILSKLWTEDSDNWIGKQLKLYCDPTVVWGGKTVGGVRISHLSDIDGPTTLKLTKTRTAKVDITILPLETITPDEQAYIDDAKANIAEAQSAADLQSIGAILKAKSPAIQAAVRETWAARQAKLKQTGTEALK